VSTSIHALNALRAESNGGVQNCAGMRHSSM